MTTNNILYVSDGNFGAPAGRLLPLMQGQFGQSIPLEIRSLDGSIPNLTGYTFTATKRQGSSVTAWAGSIVLSATPAAAPQVMMTVDEDDTGQDGGGEFFLEGTNGSRVIKTHPVSLTITKDPAVNATPAAGLVGVLTSWRTILGALYNAAQTATVGQVFIFDGDGSGAEGDAAGGGGDLLAANNLSELTATQATARANIGAETAGAAATVQGNLNTHTGNTSNPHSVTAAQVGAQASSTKLAAIDALTWVTNSILLLTGTATASVQALAAHVITFLQSTTQADARTAIGAGTGSGDLLAANNLSDVTAATARTNLAVPGLAVANTFTAAQMVDGTADAIQLRVQGHSTQTSNLQTWETSAGAVVGSITNGGVFNASSSLSVNGAQFTGFSGNGLRWGLAASWFTQTWYTDASQKMHLDINGQLGIGPALTPSARLHTMENNAATNAIVNHVIHSVRSTGTAAAGLGIATKWQLETSTTNDTDAGRMAVLWETATHASRVPDGVFYLTDSAAEREIWRGRATGSAAAIGFLGATPVARAAHIADAAGDDAATVNAILVVLENLGFVATS